MVTESQDAAMWHMDWATKIFFQAFLALDLKSSF